MIAIAYLSGSGAVARCAELMCAAIREAGEDPVRIDVTGMDKAHWQTLEQADTILFGTPTYMGGPAAGFKAFMDATGDDIWLDRKWRNKLAGGFTSGVNTGGDKLATLQALNIFAMQHGMIWIGQDIIGAPVFAENQGLNLSGTFLGLAVNANTGGLSKGCETSATLFGARVAEATKRWRVGNS
jgi:NAD(P)H dehydrogenase (quinone)